jgi:hypothetical protein
MSMKAFKAQPIRRYPARNTSVKSDTSQKVAINWIAHPVNGALPALLRNDQGRPVNHERVWLAPKKANRRGRIWPVKANG